MASFDNRQAPICLPGLCAWGKQPGPIPPALHIFPTRSVPSNISKIIINIYNRQCPCGGLSGTERKRQSEIPYLRSDRTSFSWRFWKPCRKSPGRLPFRGMDWSQTSLAALPLACYNPADL